mmetsp:Transcript_67032/g.216109  ORF Transcript_67032/g.216109 Transcript_67032/m.216109 type:complete len:229 (+) Transcript_67032:216-902(+)
MRRQSPCSLHRRHQWHHQRFREPVAVLGSCDIAVPREHQLESLLRGGHLRAGLWRRADCPSLGWHRPGMPDHIRLCKLHRAHVQRTWQGPGDGFEGDVRHQCCGRGLLPHACGPLHQCRGWLLPERAAYCGDAVLRRGHRHRHHIIRQRWPGRERRCGQVRLHRGLRFVLLRGHFIAHSGLGEDRWCGRRHGGGVQENVHHRARQLSDLSGPLHSPGPLQRAWQSAGG